MEAAMEPQLEIKEEPMDVAEDELAEEFVSRDEVVDFKIEIDEPNTELLEKILDSESNFVPGVDDNMEEIRSYTRLLERQRPPEPVLRLTRLEDMELNTLDPNIVWKPLSSLSKNRTLKSRSKIKSHTNKIIGYLTNLDWKRLEKLFVQPKNCIFKDTLSAPNIGFYFKEENVRLLKKCKPLSVPLEDIKLNTASDVKINETHPVESIESVPDNNTKCIERNTIKGSIIKSAQIYLANKCQVITENVEKNESGPRPSNYFTKKITLEHIKRKRSTSKYQTYSIVDGEIQLFTSFRRSWLNRVRIPDDCFYDFCCWYKRKHFLNKLRHKGVAPSTIRFMEIPHPCVPGCSCCCRRKEIKQTSLDVNFYPKEVTKSKINERVLEELLASISNKTPVSNQYPFKKIHTKKKYESYLDCLNDLNDLLQFGREPLTITPNAHSEKTKYLDILKNVLKHSEVQETIMCAARQISGFRVTVSLSGQTGAVSNVPPLKMSEDQKRIMKECLRLIKDKIRLEQEQIHEQEAQINTDNNTRCNSTVPKSQDDAVTDPNPPQTTAGNRAPNYTLKIPLIGLHPGIVSWESLQLVNNTPSTVTVENPEPSVPLILKNTVNFQSLIHQTICSTLQRDNSTKFQLRAATPLNIAPEIEVTQPTPAVVSSLDKDTNKVCNKGKKNINKKNTNNKISSVVKAKESIDHGKEKVIDKEDAINVIDKNKMLAQMLNTTIPINPGLQINKETEIPIGGDNRAVIKVLHFTSDGLMQLDSTAHSNKVSDAPMPQTKTISKKKERSKRKKTGQVASTNSDNSILVIDDEDLECDDSEQNNILIERKVKKQKSAILEDDGEKLITLSSIINGIEEDIL